MASENLGELGDVQADDRCHVIKLLQEQIQELIYYKNNYDQVLKRCKIAEESLRMRETEMQLKFEDMQYALTCMTEENKKLKSQLADEIGIKDDAALQNADDERVLARIFAVEPICDLLHAPLYLLFRQQNFFTVLMHVSPHLYLMDKTRFVSPVTLISSAISYSPTI